MDVKQLQYFVVSVDMGSFHSAAEALITTQPNVSKIVKSLEEELNMTLLNRTRSGVTITPQGESVYMYAIEVLKNINIIKRKFDFNDLKEKSFVITATDDKVLNKEIYNSCKENNIPVNTVDDKDNCSFIFPALARNNGVTVAISTSGKSPIYAKYLRKKIESLIQDSESIVDNLSKYREKIKNEISLEENRKVAFEKLLEYSLSNESITDDLVDKIIKDLSV